MAEVDEEDRPSPRKKRSSAKPKRKRGDRGPDREPAELDGRLHPRGVPVDGNGFYDPNGYVPESRLGEIPLDEVSSRLTKETQDAMRAHARGERRVKGPGDDQARYFIASKEHPQAKVTIQQIFPVKNQSIPVQPISALPSWADMNSFVRENYWDGEKAVFEYRIGDHKNHSWHLGQLHYAADPNFVPESDMARKNDQQQQQAQPQQPQSPYGYPPGYGAPPPGYGAPPGYPPYGPWGAMPPGMPPGMPPMMPGVFPPWMMPMMQQAMPQQAPQTAQTQSPQQGPQQPQAAAPPPPPHPYYPHPHVDPAAAALVDQNKMFFTMFLDMMKTQAQQPNSSPQDLNAMMQMFQWQMWQMQQQQAAVATAAAAEEKRKQDEAAALAAKEADNAKKVDEIEATKQGIEKLTDTIRQARRIADMLDPDKDKREAAAAAAAADAKKDEDDFPLAVKEIGIGRYAYDKHTRQPVDATTALMMNADKISEGLEKVFDKFVSAWKTRGDMSPEDAKRHADELKLKILETEGKLEAIKKGQELEAERLRVERMKLEAARAAAAPAPFAPPPPVQTVQTVATVPAPAPTTIVETTHVPQPPAPIVAEPPPASELVVATPPPAQPAPPPAPSPAPVQPAVQVRPAAGGARAPRFPGAQPSP